MKSFAQMTPDIVLSKAGTVAARGMHDDGCGIPYALTYGRESE
ncbi:MAG: hypothetical protein ABSF15_16200 [Candidatus Sulfotelmatobacter sp.]|jgi:hypothetical protein